MWLHLAKQLSLKSSLSSHLCAGTTHKIAVAYRSRPHLVRGKVSKPKASICELAKFDGHWICRYRSHENIASITSLGIVQKPAWLYRHSRYQWNLFLPHRPFNTSCPVPSTTKLSRILVIVILVGGGVPNSTLQRRWTSTAFSTFQ